MHERSTMMNIPAAAAAAAVALGLAGGATSPLPPAANGEGLVLAAGKRSDTIPANCTMDPFKKVYRCCTRDANGNVSCTETPYGKSLQLQQMQPMQTQPSLMQQPGAGQ
ncbi:MAG: hypothetical protein IRY94_00860 [Rhodospirillaceae bacterium]|nr:hypothetical protein [Rhodospirillaceae bacterium]